jgi:hypothetical protein
MLRILLYVAALVALFGGAIVYGGNAIGAWDPLPPAPKPPPAVKVRAGKLGKDRATEGTTTAPEAPSGPRTAAEKSWVRQANGLCRESRAGVEAIVAKAGDTGSYTGVVALFREVSAYNAQMNDRFLALTAPAGYRAQIEKVRALFAKEEHLFDQMSQALRHKNMDAFYRYSDSITSVALDEADILASLGAYSCDVDFSSFFGNQV